MQVRNPPRWWRLGWSLAILAVALTILATDAAAIRGSHPAYLVLLLLVVVGSAVVGASALLVGSMRTASPVEAASRRGRRLVARTAGAIASVALIGALVYLRPLGASDDAVAAMAGTPGVTVEESAGSIVLRPTLPARSTGLVFFPGALVEPRAYVPNLTPLAASGYPVVIRKPPLGVALIDRGGADAAMAGEPAVTRWVVGGHSLGGVTASAIAADDDPRVHGLLLWASYPNTSLADAVDLQVTSISASNDGLATPAKIDAARPKLPPQTVYVVVEGGTHAFFGDYGTQGGDGTASITRAEAQRQIQAASLELLQRVDSSG